MHSKSEGKRLFRRLIGPRWLDLLPVLEAETDVAQSELQDRIGQWALVLTARGIPHRVRRVSGQTQLQIQPWFQDRAVREISLYIEENASLPTTFSVPSSGADQLWPTVLGLMVLLFFHAASYTVWPGVGLYPGMMEESGSAVAGQILNGQWWRVITALTLHGDHAHFLGNMAIGGTFIMLVCGRIGAGVAWLLVLAAGAFGNLINAVVHSPSHDSIGFSTSVFGAAGLLVGIRITDGTGLDLKSTLIPVAAGLGLLAMLGSGGENTDLGAHLFGFGCGIAMGVFSGVAVRLFGKPRGWTGLIMNMVMGGTALVLVVWAWRRAFVYIFE